MENNNISVLDRKCARKQRRAHHRLARDMNIKCSEEPTEVCENFEQFFSQFDRKLVVISNLKIRIK